MLRVSRLFSLPLLLVVLASAAEAARAPSTARDDSVATFLHEAARDGALAGLKWPHFTNAQPAVDSLYARHGWSAVWTSRGRPTSDARTAIEILLDAETRGLHPDDYDAPALEQRARALSSTRAPFARDVAWFDVALSVGLLRHGSAASIRAHSRLESTSSRSAWISCAYCGTPASIATSGDWSARRSPDSPSTAS